MLDTTHELLKLRAGQINGCSGCVDSFPELKAASEPDERTFMVSACRASTYFTDAERAALALTKAVTRLALRPDPVPDEVWDEAARHYDEAQLGAARAVDRVAQQLESDQRRPREITSHRGGLRCQSC